jgi:hypothetical protein
LAEIEGVGYPEVMIRTPLVGWLLLAAGCESQAVVAADMERALRDSNDALLGALVAAELLTHVYDEPDTTGLRHDTGTCGCPCVSKLGDVPFVMTLDYPTTGCVPDSGLVPTAISGHAVVDVDQDGECRATPDQTFELGLEHGVAGNLEGEVHGTSEDQDLVAVGELAIGPTTMAVDLALHLDPSGIQLEGEVTVTPAPKDQEVRPIVLDQVTLPWDAVGFPCPRPTAGTATLVHDKNERKNTVVRFAEPGGGTVTVERDGRISEPSDYCRYVSELL